MSDEKAYEVADDLVNKMTEHTSTATVIEGDHPEHGHVQIVIPSMGESIMFRSAFKASPLVIQMKSVHV